MFAVWPQNVAVIGDRRKILAEYIDNVFNPVEACIDIARFHHPGRTAIREGNQMPGEIAAIDRGNILRFQWLQICCVVPVVEVAPVLFHAHDCGEVSLDFSNRITQAQPAEFTRTGHG